MEEYISPTQMLIKYNITDIHIIICIGITEYTYIKIFNYGIICGITYSIIYGMITEKMAFQVSFFTKRCIIM